MRVKAFKKAGLKVIREYASVQTRSFVNRQILFFRSKAILSCVNGTGTCVQQLDERFGHSQNVKCLFVKTTISGYRLGSI
jgi:hypothetical protein